jgi:hypothetical protein
VANISATRLSLTSDAGNAFNFLGRPLLDLLAHVVEAVDALCDKFLVLPSVLENVPHHPVEHRDVGPRPQPHIFGRVCGRACHARIDNDDVRVVELGTLQKVLQRHRMGFGRIAAPDDLRLRIADVVEAVGHRTVAPGIGYAGDRRRMADARLVIGVVGSPEGAELAEHVGAFIGEFG